MTNNFINPRISGDNNQKVLFISETNKFDGFKGYKFCGIHSYSQSSGCALLPQWDIINLGYITETGQDEIIDKNDRAIFLKSGEVLAPCSYDT